MTTRPGRVSVLLLLVLAAAAYAAGAATLWYFPFPKPHAADDNEYHEREVQEDDQRGEDVGQGHRRSCPSYRLRRRG